MVPHQRSGALGFESESVHPSIVILLLGVPVCILARALNRKESAMSYKPELTDCTFNLTERRLTLVFENNYRAWTEDYFCESINDLLEEAAAWQALCTNRLEQIPR